MADRAWHPCSREQEGLWLLEQSRAVGAVNAVPVGVELRGRRDDEAVRAAVERAVRRQPALRMELAPAGGRLMWREAASVPVDLAVVPAAGELDAVVARAARRVIDPLGRPPWRATLAAGPGDRHVLVLAFHHAVLDGGSVEPLLRELAGHAVAPAGFERFVAEERAAVAALAGRAGAYWPPVLEAVEDSLRLPPGGGPAGPAGAVEVELPARLRAALGQLASQRSTSVFVVLLAGLQLLQHRYAGGGDAGVATSVAMDARPRPLRGAIGMFANEAPLFSSPREDEAFAAFVDRVRDASRELFALRRFPFTEALARFGRGPERREAGAQVGLTYLRAGREPLTLGGLAVRRLGILPNGAARRPLMLWLVESPDRLGGRLEFDPAAVEPEVARGFARDYVRLLEALTSRPGRPHADAVLASPETLEPARPRAVTERVHTMVEAQVRRSPAAVAVEAGGGRLTYAELDAAANRLAHHLRDLGAAPRAPVAVCLERSPELVVALLAVLKAGAAYLPLDPGHPAARIRQVLEEARAPLVVAGRDLPGVRGRVVRLDRGAAAVVARPATAPPPSGGDLAYVIFTSGSTGTPKGVAMPHAALAGLLRWQFGAFRTQRAVRCLQFASPGFDVAFQEIFSTLATGGTLVVPGEDLRADFERLAAFVAGAGVERMFLPPLALGGLARHLGAGDRMEVIAAGERLEITPAIRDLFARRPGWTLANQYGPTETHVVTEHRLAGPAASWPARPPIGRAIDGVVAVVLDARMRPVPAGVPGELHLGGRCLAEGYLGRPRLTAERFVAGPHGRLYRTGDLVRRRPDGELEFLDRVDEQLKVRGFRVEPGEIRARLLERPEVRDAVVIARERRLVAYVVPEPGFELAPVALRAHLQRRLPEFMVPAAFAVLPELPVTRNGKLDRRALPEPGAAAGTPWVEPRTATERVLAGLWAEVLGLERVGVHDDFFALGGHSLLAGELVARARSALGRDVSLRLVFAGPTVAQMAATLDRGEGVDAPAPRAVRRPLSEVLRE